MSDPASVYNLNCRIYASITPMAPVRVALIGLGAVSRDIHLPTLAAHPRATLIAAADPVASGRAYAASVVPSLSLYQHAEAMLSAERPDLVVVATPPHTHGELCLLALHHGAHVLCEKPFVGSLAEADDVITAARIGQRQVAVNHQYRYLPFYRKPARRLRAGAFGRLYYMQAQQHIFVTPDQEVGWRGELRHRVLFEFGMHVLDLLNYFFESDPIAVSARMPRVLPRDQTDALVVLRLDYPGERVASVVLNRVSRAAPRYLDLWLECERASIRTAFGGVAEVRLSWSSERRRPTFRLSLARGGEAWAEAGGRTWRLARAGREARPAATAAHLTALLDAVAAGVEPPVSARYARGLLQTVLAAYESAERDGELIRLPELAEGRVATFN